MRTQKRKLVDPIQFAISISSEDLSDYVPTFDWEKAPASQKQIEYLQDHGIFADEVANARLASLLINRLKERQGLHLSTPKQIRFLERKGSSMWGPGALLLPAA